MGKPIIHLAVIGCFMIIIRAVRIQAVVSRLYRQWLLHLAVDMEPFLILDRC